MLTKTTEIGIRTLLYLGAHPAEKPVSPRQLGEALGESPTYLSKVAALLTKAGIVRSLRGAAGGITLNSLPESISLLDILQACQGAFLPDYCSGAGDPRSACSFHQAMAQLHSAVIEVLSSWTLADLLEKTCPQSPRPEFETCKIRIRREPATVRNQ